MSALTGAMLGFLVGVAGITLVGSILGGLGGWSPCHGPTHFVGGAFFGCQVYLIVYGLPVGLLGSLVGGVAGWQAARRTPGRKPSSRPWMD